MGNLSNNFCNMLKTMGMKTLAQPIFYNSKIGIRFEIGGNEGVYLNDMTSHKTINPAYISAAFNRAKSIYKSLPHVPNILRIDVYPNNQNSIEETISLICQATEMPKPHEQVAEPFQWNEENEPILRFQLYWDFERITFSPDVLLQEIIKADIGGCNELASNVYFADTNNSVLFYLYDDRGADLVAGNKDLLRPIYEEFNCWILDYDRDKINETFAK